VLLGRGRFRALLPRHGPATRPPSRSMPTRAAQPPPHAPAGPICASSARRTPAAVASDRLLQLPHAAAAAAQQPSRARRPADPRRQGPTVAYFRPQGGAQPHAQRAAAVAAAATAAWRVPSERRVLDQDQVPDQATREATVRQPRRPGPRRTTTSSAARGTCGPVERRGGATAGWPRARTSSYIIYIILCLLRPTVGWSLSGASPLVSAVRSPLGRPLRRGPGRTIYNLLSIFTIIPRGRVDTSEGDQMCTPFTARKHGRSSSQKAAVALTLHAGRISRTSCAALLPLPSGGLVMIRAARATRVQRGYPVTRRRSHLRGETTA